MDDIRQTMVLNFRMGGDNACIYFPTQPSHRGRSSGHVVSLSLFINTVAEYVNIHVHPAAGHSTATGSRDAARQQSLI